VIEFTGRHPQISVQTGYADSFAAALAIEYGATLVSADPAFEKLEKKLKWMKLPRFHG
jgi:predicted nucleic acid-binding protein